MGALERDEWLRAAWKVMVSGTLDARSLVFVDEMGTNTSLSPLYGWTENSQRAYCSVPRNRGKNTTLLSSMSMEGMGPSRAVEGATNREVFETYVERVLRPTLRRGQVVVMDTGVPWTSRRIEWKKPTSRKVNVSVLAGESHSVAQQPYGRPADEQRHQSARRNEQGEPTGVG